MTRGNRQQLWRGRIVNFESELRDKKLCAVAVEVDESAAKPKPKKKKKKKPNIPAKNSQARVANPVAEQPRADVISGEAVAEEAVEPAVDAPVADESSVCPVCCTEMPLLKLSCEHSFCKECLENQIKVRAEAVQEAGS